MKTTKTLSSVQMNLPEAARDYAAEMERSREALHMLLRRHGYPQMKVKPVEYAEDACDGYFACRKDDTTPRLGAVMGRIAADLATVRDLLSAEHAPATAGSARA